MINTLQDSSGNGLEVFKLEIYNIVYKDAFATNNL